MSHIQLKNVNKIYGVGNVAVHALNDVSFNIEEGEFVVILGASGAGKSTLLNIMGGMDSASDGEFFVDNLDICSLNDKELSKFRRNDVGFVFQFYNLMPNLTALENVEIAGSLVKNAMDPRDALKEVGLEERMNKFPSQLSGGEQQRVAIARAIVKNPKLLLCDEPTGALDSKTGVSIIKLLYKLSKELKTTVIIVTHNAKLADVATRVLRICDGKIIEDKKVDNPCNIDEIIW